MIEDYKAKMEISKANMQMSFLRLLRNQPAGTRIATVWGEMMQLFPEYTIEEIKKVCMPVAWKLTSAHF